MKSPGGLDLIAAYATFKTLAFKTTQYFGLGFVLITPYSAEKCEREQEVFRCSSLLTLFMSGFIKTIYNKTKR
jgi:hypothetical protein